MTDDPGDNPVTRLLGELRDGRSAAADELLPLVYDQLRAIAQQRMNEERPGHMLEATALVHEAYLRLVGSDQVAWDGKAHFYVAAAEAMRRVLIEHARARGRIKRGGDHRRLPLSVVDLGRAEDSEGILSFDEAFRRLEAEAPDAAGVVRLRFFAGLSVENTARVLGVSDRTVNRTWRFARARMLQILEETSHGQRVS
jgi:RNA polymerase sigma factor (TIGR02999 family)